MGRKVKAKPIAGLQKRCTFRKVKGALLAMLSRIQPETEKRIQKKKIKGAYKKLVRHV